MIPVVSVPARPARHAAWFTAGSAMAAAARGFAVAGLLTTVVYYCDPGMTARWFVIPLLAMPGAFAPLLAKQRRVRAILGGRNVTSLFVLASFFRAGLVCTIPWARTPGLLVAETAFFGVVSLAVGLLETWLRWTWPAGSVARTAWLAAVMSIGLGAVTAIMGIATVRTTGDVTWFYGGASLFVLSGIITSFGGSATLDGDARA